jgi:hypothetical protein
MWYRVFGVRAAEPNAGALLEWLNRVAVVRGRFHGDDAGWFHAELQSDDLALLVDRYTVDEEGIRAELNTWAAAVEASDEDAGDTALLEHLIQTQQLFMLEGAETASGRRLCVALCQYLAQVTDGIYQMDGQGLFACDGRLLWRET